MSNLVEPTTYACAACGGTFDKGWSDAEAMAEARQKWEADDLTDAACVCDDCYQEMIAARLVAVADCERRRQEEVGKLLLRAFVDEMLHTVLDPILKSAAKFIAQHYGKGKIRRAKRHASAEHRRLHPKAHRGGRW